MSLTDPPIPDDEVTLAERGLAAWMALDPEINTVDGGAEEQIFEAVATPIATAAYVVRESMRSAYADVVGRVVRVERDAAQAAIAVATVTLNSSAGHTLTAGTPIPLTKDGEQVEFMLARDVVFPSGTTVQIGVQLVAGDIGPDTNGASDPADWTDARIAAVDVTSSAAGGSDEESDDELLTRIERRGRRVNFAPVAAPDYAEASLDDEEVGRCAYKNRWTPTAPTTSTVGHVTIWPINSAGGNVSSECAARLAAQFTSDDQPLNVTVHIQEPPRVNIAILVHAELHPDYTEEDATAAIEAAIPERNGPAVWDYSRDAPGYWLPTTQSFTTFDVAAAIDDLPHITRVLNVTVNGGASVPLTSGSVPVVLPNITSVGVTFA